MVLPLPAHARGSYDDKDRVHRAPLLLLRWADIMTACEGRQRQNREYNVVVRRFCFLLLRRAVLRGQDSGNQAGFLPEIHPAGPVFRAAWLLWGPHSAAGRKRSSCINLQNW